MKIVIHAYKTECKNKEFNIKDAGTYWGLGDLLRGTMKLYQMSEILNFKLYADISLHPMAKYLAPSKHPYVVNVEKYCEYINLLYIDTLEDHIIKFMVAPTPLIILNTNDILCKKYQISTNCKQFMRNIMTPSDELAAYITLKKNEMKLIDGNYNVLHIRTGDDQFFESNNPPTRHILYSKLYKYINIILSNYEVGDLVISDNTMLKYYIATYMPNIKCSNLQICHLGLCNISTYSDLFEYEAMNEKIKDTLTEFFITAGCSTIKTYSIYSWISGFVERIHQIYDVPLKLITNCKYLL